MNTRSNSEKAKPFRLVKYFSIAGLIVIFIGTIVLSMLNIHWARAMQRKQSEDYALLLVENLNHQIFLQFVLPVMLKYGKIQTGNREQFERLDKVVRSTLHSFKVEKVNIYSMDDTVSYSFDQELVGAEDLGGTGYFRARDGQTVFRQIQRGNFLEILLGIPKEIKITIFAPLRAERPLSHISGPVLGVIEIVQDLSEDYKTIFNFQIFVIITSAAVMSILSMVLILVVKRGEGIIEKRARERLRLKEQLSHAEHLSTLGEMVAGISHEIRNPLGIIRSSAELLKKKVFTIDPSNKIPNIIIEEASRLNNIITDFLNYAKPKSPNFMPCRVEEVLEKNITYLSSQIKEQGYSIHKHYPSNLPEIMADSAMLYQAFLNILINAQQSMQDGGTINVEISSNDSLVSILFQDEGDGIPEYLVEKIWDPFLTTKEKGTGLGLGIVKNIIESHGGTIKIENRSAGGAQVTVALPVKQGD
ncbi:MAG: two-component sensor histidine kinase [Deltaproteobacteria bacterium]|nr:MAG: two-component sensor histidine kinase [Deltaproteobacteria bacterium]